MYDLSTCRYIYDVLKGLQVGKDPSIDADIGYIDLIHVRASLRQERVMYEYV